MNMISELKRRNVFRAGVAWLALSWLLIAIADLLFPHLGVPLVEHRQAAADVSIRWLTLHLIGRPEEPSALLQPLDRAGHLHALAGFLSYPQFDVRPMPDLLEILEREGAECDVPRPIPFTWSPEEDPG